MSRTGSSSSFRCVFFARARSDVCQYIPEELTEKSWEALAAYWAAVDLAHCLSDRAG